MTFSITNHQFKTMDLVNQPLVDCYLYEQINKGNTRVPLFGNMLFDQVQIISNNDMTQQEIQDFLVEMGEFHYSDIGLFFIPNDALANNSLVHDIRSYVDKFKKGVETEICSGNPIIFAEKTTKDGLFLCMNDDSLVFLDDLVAKHEDSFVIVMNEDNPPEGSTLYFENREEASGTDFFSYFNRENPEIFNLLKTLGAFDKDCFFWNEDEEDSDNE